MIEEYILSLLQTRLADLRDRPFRYADAEELELCERSIITLSRQALATNYNLTNGDNTNDR